MKIIVVGAGEVGSHITSHLSEEGNNVILIDEDPDRVEEASQIYFGKRAQDLTLLQAALLAGLPNSPNSANPFNNMDRAMKRARFVLKRMANEGWITAEQIYQRGAEKTAQYCTGADP